MKVLLCNPPVPDRGAWIREGRCQDVDRWSVPFPPLTLAYLATQIDRTGRSLIVDAPACRQGLPEVLGEIEVFAPELLVFATATPTIRHDLEWFLPAVRARFPQLRTAATGVHVSVFAERILRDHPLLDFILVGEPEVTAAELVAALRSGAPLGEVKGLAWRDDGRVRLNPARPYVEDLDDLGFPAWEKVDLSRYQMPIKGRPFSLINFSRGCPFSCTFCVLHSYYGKKIRKRSPEHLIEEIRRLNQRGIHDFLIWTEFMTADREYLDRFLALIFAEKLERKNRWVTNLRTDFADETVFRRMKQAGCWQVVFGIEFGTDEMLTRVRKGGKTSVAASTQAVRAAARAGLAVAGHFIVGYPGETLAQIDQTVRLARRIPLTFAHFYPATPFPGSTLYDEAVAEGAIEEDCWDNFYLSQPSLKSREFDTAQIGRIIQNAYRRFYADPRVWWRILRLPANAGEWRNVLRIGLRFARGASS